MTYKAVELAMLEKGKGCLAKAAPDEPIFILRGQDEFAAALVEMWASAVAGVRGHDHPKVREALRCAAAMKAWPTKKVPD